MSHEPEVIRVAQVFDRHGYLHLLIDRGLTSRKLARLLGVKPNVLHHLSWGQGAKAEIQRRIADALGCEPSDLWHDVTYRPRLK